jgi:transcriptional regulator with XRE-family HTH domain
MAQKSKPDLNAKYRAVGILVGNEIRLRRLEKEMTQSDLAVAKGISAESFARVSRVENATARVGLEELYEIAEALGCEASDLLPTMKEWRQQLAAAN